MLPPPPFKVEGICPLAIPAITSVLSKYDVTVSAPYKYDVTVSAPYKYDITNKLTFSERVYVYCYK